MPYRKGVLGLHMVKGVNIIAIGCVLTPSADLCCFCHYPTSSQIIAINIFIFISTKTIKCHNSNWSSISVIVPGGSGDRAPGQGNRGIWGTKPPEAESFSLHKKQMFAFPGPGRYVVEIQRHNIQLEPRGAPGWEFLANSITAKHTGSASVPRWYRCIMD